MDENHIEEIEETAMGDDNIRTYFPKARICVYNKLNNIDSIHEFLPNNKSYFFMLIEDSPNRGHWVCMNKLNNVIEFFDSYGGAPDTQLKWMGKENNKMLGQGHHRLSELLKDSGCKVVYNPIHYQQENEDIKTCGRHCCLRIKKMLEGKNLDDYNKFMENNKNSSGMDYDEIVSFFIQH
jgi:hypothetical protein